MALRNLLSIFLKWSTHRVHPLFQKRGLDRTWIFRGEVAGKEGWFFSAGERGCSSYIKNKKKSEILNDKKNYKQANVYLP